MNAERLQKVLEKVPGEYEIIVKNEIINISLSDVVEIDLENKQLILK